ncbi:FAD binding domain-containing protein [Xanthobacter autotrophicus]|uniref:FAD binding domain-containing protein n=1 Tax=Xanthobacter autotrophicus TaxID=280 RepID=UPI003729D649
MKPAAFDYHRAQTIPDALKLIARFGGEAKVLAGGQSLGPMLNLRVARPAHVIDLNDLVELDSVRRAGDRLVVGALTRHHRVATDPEIAAACPILSAAAATIGHYAIRQRGTLGGSLCHADPAAQMPLVATLLDAEIRVESAAGRRSLRARDFFKASLVTTLAPDEMVTTVAFPVAGPRSGWGFELFSRRHGDFALVSVATTLALAPDGTVAELRLALGGIAPTSLALDATLAGHLGARPDAAWRALVAAEAAAAVAPDDDPLVPALYRKELAASLATRALSAALARAGGGLPYEPDDE